MPASASSCSTICRPASPRRCRSRCCRSSATTGDQALVAELIEDHGVDAIIHFAGSIVVPDSVHDPLGYYRNNTVNSRALIETAVKGGVRHFIFSSTAAVYGNPARVPVAEDDADRADVALRLVEADDRGHAARHQRARTACSHVILRYFNVAGADPQLRTGQSTPGRDASHQGRGRGRARPAREDRRVRHRLSDAGRHLHPRLHPRQRSRARASRRARAICARGGASATLNCGYGRGYSVLRGDRRGAPRHRPRFPGATSADAGPATSRSSVAAASRIRELLRWTPQLDDLDTIVAPRARLGTPSHGPEHAIARGGFSLISGGSASR